ncbi:MAG: tandem-95 repeat protein [Deltaproteobacteria bacterium]|nr:tandem-95 repeat protein [Deltaproteobacteria bacterium]
MSFMRTIGLLAMALTTASNAAAAPPIGVRDAYVTGRNAPLSIAAPGLSGNDFDPEGDPFVVSNYSPPAHGTLTSIVTNGSFVYVPDPGFVGTDSFVYLLMDEANDASNETLVTIEVLADPNRAPIGTGDAYGTPAGTTLTIPAPGLLANDYDPDGNELVATNYSEPSHGTLTSIVTDGSFVYVPKPGFVGTDAFQYILQDESGLSSIEVPVTIEILAAGPGNPVGIADAYVTPRDTTLSVGAPGLTANDRDPAGEEFMVTNYSTPAHGTVTSIVTNGSFTYVPDPGFVGTDSFVYLLMDASNDASNETLVTIEVLPDFNRAPVGTPDEYGTPVGVTLSVPAPGLAANDYDPDGDELIVSNYFPPAHGTVTSIVTDGSFVYVPDPGFNGIDRFEYALVDSSGEFSSTTRVTIQVPEATQLASLLGGCMFLTALAARRASFRGRRTDRREWRNAPR